MPLQLVHDNAIFAWMVPPDGTIETFKELGIYCPSCFSISKDLGSFARPSPKKNPART